MAMVVLIPRYGALILAISAEVLPLLLPGGQVSDIYLGKL
jgi:hypothetical protein